MRSKGRAAPQRTRSYLIRYTMSMTSPLVLRQIEGDRGVCTFDLVERFVISCL